MLFFLLGILTGCAAQIPMETVFDEQELPAPVQPREISVELPEEAQLATVESGSGRLYLSEDFTVSIETMQGGNLAATVQSLTGFALKDLTVVQTDCEAGKRYEFVWTSMTDLGPCTGRGVVIDDGSYHYCMSVLRPLERVDSSQIVWSRVFQSFSLV